MKLQIIPETDWCKRDGKGRDEDQTGKCARAEALRWSTAREEQTTTESSKVIMKDELIKSCLPAIKTKLLLQNHTMFWQAPKDNDHWTSFCSLTQ